MVVNGIIAEYNPFHNGHAKHIQLSKKKTGADYTIVALSGNFVQRGAPSLIDKFTRAQMALENGADLVLEIPTIYSASSAEYYAKGAVSLLDKLGIVNYLCFGSESGDLGILQRIAKIFANEPKEYSELLQKNLKLGNSYPLARTNALVEYDPSLYDATRILSTPNNILAIEYLKCLEQRHSGIIPVTIARMGSGYHDRFLGDTSFSSSTAIRESIASGNSLEGLKCYMPESAYDLLSSYLEEHSAMDCDSLSSILLFKLFQEKDYGYTKYLDINQDLSDRIVNNLYEFKNYSQFCDLLKSKDRTYTRISRCLLHILLNITEDVVENGRMLDYTPYARILGFRKDSEELLTAIKSNSRIPMISKLSTSKDKLFDEPYRMLKTDIAVSEVYAASRAIIDQSTVQNEISTPIIVIE